MRRECVMIFLLSWIAINVCGQTVLYPGDISVLGIQTDNPDNFSFVFLTSIQKHTVVYFTDCGVKADGSFRNGEGGLKFVAPEDLAAGTLVNYIRDSSDFSKVNDQILGNRGFNLSSTGDQIIAFQDSSIHPRFLFAIQTNSSRWQNECTNSNVSCLPPGLMEGYSAICAGKDTGASNYWHNGVIKFLPSGKTKNETRAALCNRNNWSFGNSIITLPSEKLNLIPDSNRYVKFQQGTRTIYNMNDSIGFEIVESNIDRLTIWFENMNLQDSILIQSHWSVSEKNFKCKLPNSSICDSFQFIFADADFPGFNYRSQNWFIKDTIPLRFVNLEPASIKSGDSITLIFNRIMLPICDSLILRNNSNMSDSLILTYSTGAISMNGEEIVLRLNNAKPGTSYQIEIKEGWMTDIKGNPFSGIDNNSYPIFEVMAQDIIDSTAPEIVSVEPSLDEPISLDQKIKFVFNEPLYSGEGEITDPDVLADIISVQDLTEDNFYDFIIEFDSLFTSFTILPLGLEKGKTYFISMYGFSDSIGNECEEFIYTFETEQVADRVRPSVRKDSLLIFPNPAGKILQIGGNNFIKSAIEVLDICGKRRNITITEQSDDKILLDISALKSGIYIVQIENNGEMKRARFIKN